MFCRVSKQASKNVYPWSSLVEGDEGGSYRPDNQTNIAIAIHELSLVSEATTLPVAPKPPKSQPARILTLVTIC